MTDLRRSIVADSACYVAAMTFPQRLAQALQLSGMKQSELAEAMGVKKQTISSYLTAKRDGEDRAMSASNAAKAARILKVDHYWLATGEGDPRPTLLMERLALSPKAVHIGDRFDAIEDPKQRDRAYALIVQLLEFSGKVDPH